MPDITKYFDDIRYISLKRRPERSARFYEEMISQSWPFELMPRLYYAVDGLRVTPPAGWFDTSGAWGCLRSHLNILEEAMNTGVRRLLIFEDDVCFVENFAIRLEVFLHKVQHMYDDRWEMMYLGGKHFEPPIDFEHGIVRCRATRRTHAYAVNLQHGGFAVKLYHLLLRARTHIDVVMTQLHHDHIVIAPSPFLCGQDKNWSDIGTRHQPREF